MPTSNLVNDSDGKSTKFSTFLNNGSILAQIDTQFQRFSASGKPIDVVEFQDHNKQFRGEKLSAAIDTIHYKVFWHDYLCANDEGINKQMFIC